MKMNDIAKMVEKVGIPGSDRFDLPTSKKRFPDGAWYRMEISGIERPNVLEALIDEMDKRKTPIHRAISMVMGATYLDKKELKDFATIAKEAQLEVIVTPGPRAAWDIGRQPVTPEGAFSGARFRGAEQVKAYIADMFRCIDAGFKGFLVTDEGLMWLLNEMKIKGDVPKDITFKVSVYAGHGNPAGAKLLESIGAGTFNPVGDLTVPQLATIRQTVDIPMDLHILLAESFGGFTRFYDAPEMVRTCAPCYFKIEPGPACLVGPGAMYKPWTDAGMLANFAREKVKYAQTINEIIQENFPEATMSKKGAKGLAIPTP
ncbi:MAG: hypothetical protein PHX21_04730 [bacterium]|nr:hypothetical protein [bacterium]